MFSLPTLPSSSAAPAHGAPPDPRSTQAAAAIGRVLVIDDDQPMCETLGTVLARRGFSVVWRTRGADAMALLDQGDFDVVLTDLNMDGMDGYALCRHVRATHPRLPVVVLTAFGTLASEATARAMGAWAFLAKPFDLGHLRTTLASAVAHHRTRDA